MAMLVQHVLLSNWAKIYMFAPTTPIVSEHWFKTVPDHNLLLQMLHYDVLKLLQAQVFIYIQLASPRTCITYNIHCPPPAAGPPQVPGTLPPSVPGTLPSSVPGTLPPSVAERVTRLEATTSFGSVVWHYFLNESRRIDQRGIKDNETHRGNSAYSTGNETMSRPPLAVYF